MSGSDPVDDDQRLRDLQRQYVDILDDPGSGFDAAVRQMISRSSSRLVVNINVVRSKNAERARGLLTNFVDEMTAFQRALREFVGSIDPDYAKRQAQSEGFHIGLEGSFGSHHLNPRTLTASRLNHLVCLEGIVTKCSMVNPKVVQSVHYCPATAKTVERHYTDLVSLEAFPSSAAYPTQDEDGNPLQTEYGLSVYKDHQTITIQELPEKAPTGQLPRAVDVICEHDLVDRCKPGDRIHVVGSYRCLPSKQGGFTSGTFRAVVIANNVITRDGDGGDDDSFTAADIDMIKKAARSEKNIFDTLAHSLAPSIHGHEYIKRALLCLMLGGVEKVLPNGSRLRGDINILLIGDPSVAKSQLLRYVLSTAERAVTTTGRGSSGVGLTAAVTTDQETGERRLEAGAMVLADKGIVCIDEFDKMTDMDRTAIHEVMEQGKVSISKAGIHARLNARCSVLAAANPVYGRYDPCRTPMENIGLQDSLLSRFDLLFVMLDSIDVETDKKIADHVVGIHRYRSSKEADGSVTDVGGSSVDDLDTAGKRKRDSSATTTGGSRTSIWDKHNFLGAAAASREKFLAAEFVKKYISYARASAPALTEKACELIGEEYSQIRSQICGEGTDLAKTQPITARCLETMIRLATAHAKARLSTKVEKKDAELAIRLVQYAYFKKVVRDGRKRRKNVDDSDGDEVEEEASMDEEDEEEDDEVTIEPAAKRPRQSSSGAAAQVPAALMEAFKKRLSELFTDTQHLQYDEVVRKMVSEKVCANEDQVMDCIKVMTDENKVMLSADVLYWI